MHSKENLLLNPDFIDILAAFSEEKVEYLVVGGYAMAFHGFVRAGRGHRSLDSSRDDVIRLEEGSENDPF
jgi:hypothetical protein